MCSSVRPSPDIADARRTASSTRIVYASFFPGLRWNEQYAQEAVQTFVRLRCRLTLNITRSPLRRGRTSCGSGPSHIRASLGERGAPSAGSEEQTAELQSRQKLVCRLLL